MHFFKGFHRPLFPHPRKHCKPDASERGDGKELTDREREERRRARPKGIAITQPRRVAAIGAAQRVAQERGGEVGGEVGYEVRARCADRKGSDDSVTVGSLSPLPSCSPAFCNPALAVNTFDSAGDSEQTVNRS